MSRPALVATKSANWEPTVSAPSAALGALALVVGSIVYIVAKENVCAMGVPKRELELPGSVYTVPAEISFVLVCAALARDRSSSGLLHFGTAPSAVPTATRATTSVFSITAPATPETATRFRQANLPLIRSHRKYTLMLPITKGSSYRTRSRKTQEHTWHITGMMRPIMVPLT